MPTRSLNKRSTPSTRSIPEPELRRMNRLLQERRLRELTATAQKLLANPDLSPQVRARVHNLICHAFCQQGKDTLDAVLHGQRALRMARRLRDRQLQGEALANYAWACYLAGYYHVVIRTCRALERRPERHDPDSATARAWQYYQAARRLAGEPGGQIAQGV